VNKTDAMCNVEPIIWKGRKFTDTARRAVVPICQRHAEVPVRLLNEDYLMVKERFLYNR
jgi:hypothetical protein